MTNIFGGLVKIDPDFMSTVENDYWEEFTKVNDSFAHEPELVISKTKKSSKIIPCKPKETFELGPSNKIYPNILKNSENDEDQVRKESKSDVNENEQQYVEYRSVAVQTDGNYDDEPELPYKCCLCFRSSTPCVVWIFVGISIVFFKMGAIVTGRWIYLSSSSFDEVVFYIAFTVCLGFATIYFRRGTKYHNCFDICFLILTIPIMWALLTFTTTFLKKDMFFYVGSVIYSSFIIPYTILGSYISYRFWKQGKLFLRRSEGNKLLEPYCRKMFFTQSLIVFDTQLSICAAIISIAPTINQNNTAVVSSLIVAPISISISIISLIVGYFAIRKENKTLAWVFSCLSANQFLLVMSMLAKRPLAKGIYSAFINVNILLWTSVILIIHIGLLYMVWKWIVPNFGRGLKGSLNRTSRNNCLQFAKLTICR